MFKESGVDRVILGPNSGKDYNVNETIEFFQGTKKVLSIVINGIKCYCSYYSPDEVLNAFNHRLRWD